MKVVKQEKCFAYTAQTGCDKNGYVMDVTVNPSNAHNSVAFYGLYGRMVEKNPDIEVIVADAGYKTPLISKKSLDDGKIPVFTYKRSMSKKNFSNLMNMYMYMYTISIITVPSILKIKVQSFPFIVHTTSCIQVCA